MHKWQSTERTYPPTGGLDSVFIASTIDVKESRKVVTVDIPGAFLHTDNEDYVIMEMVGTLVELMVKTTQSYNNRCHIGER